jgi:hypothetical protein
MTKSKTNALDTLRALIAERQQYDQWISTLESKRDGTPEQVFNRVYSDYASRRDRVVEEIKSHAEELQLSIAALSARLGEVAKEEDARRETLQEAELRAAVGEYDVAQWESLQAEANRELGKIASERASLENQLAELDSIRKLSEVTALGAETSAAASVPMPVPVSAQPEASKPAAFSSGPDAAPVSATRPFTPERDHSDIQRPALSEAGWPTRDIVESPAAAAPPAAPLRSAASSASTPSTPSTVLASAPAPPAPASRPFSVPPEPPRATTDPAATAPRPSAFPPAPPPAPAPPSRKKRDTPSGKDSQISAGFSKPVSTPSDSRPEVNKTLKCPECGTANYPTEWYCERCGGELATM